MPQVATSPKIITKEEADKLHNAGVTTDKETQARNADALAEAAEKYEGGTIDLKDIEEDREIQYHLNHNELEVTGKKPGRVYKWVYTGQQGRFVMQAKQQGWVVVTGDDPEAIELKSVDNTRRLADVLLMWTSESRYQKITARQQDLNRRQQEGITASLEEQANKHGVIVHDGGNSPTMSAVMKRAGARQTAAHAVGSMLKAGSVPGMRVR